MASESKRYPYDPDYAVPPGETLREWMTLHSRLAVEVATEAQMERPVVEGILDGSEPITPEFAQRLHMVTGMGVTFWLNLEVNYRKQLKRMESTDET